MLPYSDSFYSANPMFVGILWNSGYRDRAHRDSAMRKTRRHGWPLGIAPLSATVFGTAIDVFLFFLLQHLPPHGSGFSSSSLNWRSQGGQRCPPSFFAAPLRTGLPDVALLIAERRGIYPFWVLSPKKYP